MEDLFDLYDGLEEFQQKQEEKNKELKIIEDKYEEVLNLKQQLENENHSLKKDIKRMELNFQSLLDTARAEIRRKDNEIEELRRLKDDLCFRRLQGKIAAKNSDEKHAKKDCVPQEPIAVLNEQHTNVVAESRNSNQEKVSFKEAKESSRNIKKYSPERKSSRSRDRKEENRSSRHRRELNRRDEHDTEHYRRKESDRKRSFDRYDRNDRRDFSKNRRS